MAANLRLTKLEWTFIVLGAVSVMLLVWFATQKYGLGVSSDSAFYLSSADSFLSGRGFFDFEGNPILFWPPLYPFVLSVISLATGLSPLVSGKVLNILTYGLVILFSAILYKRCFKDRVLWFYLATLATILFLPLLTTAANISTDLIFIWFELVFFLAASDFMKKKSRLSLLGLSALIAFATLLRWVGYLMILTEIMLVWIVEWKEKKTAIIDSLVFGGIAAFPFIAWAFGRNYLQYHSFFGPRDTGLVSISGNILLTFVKINQWLFPVSLTQKLPVIIIWLVLLGLLMLVNRRIDWLRWVLRWVTDPILPILIFSVLYYLFITLTIYTQDHLITAYYDDRLQAPLFFALIIGLFLTLDELILAHIRPGWKKLEDGVLISLFVLWAIYPITLIDKFTILSLENGVVAYNLYNTKQIHDSGLVKFLMEHSLDSGTPVYSNIAEEVYLITGLPVKSSPADKVNYYASPITLRINYPVWPEAPQAYLIWIHTNQKRNYYSPQDLKQAATLKKLYDGPDGQIFIAKPK